MLFHAERPDVGKSLVMHIVDAEIFREGKKLPGWREAGSFTESGNGEVEKQDRQIRWQNAKSAPHIEAANRRPTASCVRTKKLRADEISTKDKKEIDAHPAAIRWAAPYAVPQRKAHVPKHHPKDGDGAHQIQAWFAGGGCVEKLQPTVL